MSELEKEESTTVEVVENQGVESGLATVNGGDLDILGIAEKIEKWAEAANKIRKAVMKLAYPGDWVIFDTESGDDGKETCGEIGSAGAERIFSYLPFSASNWEARKITGQDDKGDWYRWEYEADIALNGKVLRPLGRAGSRDKFYGKAHGEWKPLSDISEGDIKIAARRAVIKEGVRTHLGLRHVPLSVLKELGVKAETAKGHKFGKKDAAATDDEKKIQLEIGKMLMEIAGNDKERAAELLESVTAFKGKDGNMVPGVKSCTSLAGKRLQIAHGKVKDEYKRFCDAADKFGKGE